MRDYRQHYEKYIPVYEELSTSNGGKTVWIPTDAHDGWYVSGTVQDEDTEAWDRGYPRKSRPSILPDDLSPDVERTAYTTISYAPDEAYKTRYYKEEDGDIKWMDDESQRLPDYGEITAWSLFVDIDIDKDYKQRPLPDDHKKIISDRLQLWGKAFSEMGGGMDKVHMLDSGGGMYVFLPPTCLSPVSERYDQEDLNLIFNEIGKRMRTVTGKLNDLICDQDDAPKELFSADKVQNKNRQFKTIGSIHKDLDAVVYPILPEDVEIHHKTVDSVSDKDVERAMNWSKSFTSDRHRESVGSIIEYLFQGDFTEREDIDLEHISGSSWAEILDTWLEGKKESIRAWEQSVEERQDISEDKLKTDITQDRSVARESIRRVNNRKLKDYIIDFVGADMAYDKAGEEMDFFPFWRGGSTESGRSAFYDFYEGKARFTDKSDGTSRDIVYWMALEMTYDDNRYPNADMIDSPGEDLDPGDYRRAIKELRNRGEDIPILVPEVEDNEELSDWRVKEIALELGIADRSDVVEDEEGDESLKPQVWNETIDRLEHEGIRHNRDKKRPLDKSDIKPPSDPDSVERMNRQKRFDLFFNETGYYEEGVDMSKSEYLEFIESLPRFVIPFTYDGKIGGSEVEGAVAGVFVDQSEEGLSLSRFEPFPYKSADAINSYTDVNIEVNENLDKKKMRILEKP